MGRWVEVQEAVVVVEEGLLAWWILR